MPAASTYNIDPAESFALPGVQKYVPINRVEELATAGLPNRPSSRICARAAGSGRALGYAVFGSLGVARGMVGMLSLARG